MNVNQAWFTQVNCNLVPDSTQSRDSLTTYKINEPAHKAMCPNEAILFAFNCQCDFSVTLNFPAVPICKTG